MSLLACFLIPLFFGRIALGEFNYCSINSSHTMCLFKYQSKNCVEYRTQNLEETIAILESHNEARSKFAGGHTGYFVPNMLKLYWDDELANISARWACQCKGTVDYNRDVDRFQVGQIAYKIEAEEDVASSWNHIWARILEGSGGFFSRNLWGRTITNFNSTDPLSYIYNPYVQYLGCTLSSYKMMWLEKETKGEHITVLICNYAPMKARYSKKYSEDFPCKKCPRSTACPEEVQMSDNTLPERNLCFDNALENMKPTPAEPCPTKQPCHHGQTHSQYYSYDRIATDHAMLADIQHLGTDESIGVDDWKHVNDSEGITVPHEFAQYNDNDYDDDDAHDQFQLPNGTVLSFCKIKCPAPHTLCVYKNKSKNCEGFINMMCKDCAKRLLDLHNTYRNNYAAGRLGLPHPMASNMRMMMWSTQLEAIAYRWVSQCTIGGDKCRNAYLLHPSMHDNYILRFKR